MVAFRSRSGIVQILLVIFIINSVNTVSVNKQLLEEYSPEIADVAISNKDSNVKIIPVQFITHAEEINSKNDNNKHTTNTKDEFEDPLETINTKQNGKQRVQRDINSALYPQLPQDGPRNNNNQGSQQQYSSSLSYDPHRLQSNTGYQPYGTNSKNNQGGNQYGGNVQGRSSYPQHNSSTQFSRPDTYPYYPPSNNSRNTKTPLGYPQSSMNQDSFGRNSGYPSSGNQGTNNQFKYPGYPQVNSYGQNNFSSNPTSRNSFNSNAYTFTQQRSGQNSSYPSSGNQGIASNQFKYPGYPQANSYGQNNFSTNPMSRSNFNSNPYPSTQARFGQNSSNSEYSVRQPQYPQPNSRNNDQNYSRQTPGQYPQYNSQYPDQNLSNLQSNSQYPGRYFQPNSQNSSQYQNNSQFSGQYPQYPSQNSQYPQSHSQNSGLSSPYIGQHSQYPGQSLQYPQSNSQNLSQNSPYTGQHSQHPDQNARYPQYNSQNPSQISPYTGQNSQNLGQNVQYPQTNSRNPSQYPNSGQNTQYEDRHFYFPTNSSTNNQNNYQSFQPYNMK